MGTSRLQDERSRHEWLSGEQLLTWKEVSSYLKHDVRTVQRWERSRGLPVHRLPGGSRRSIYALTSELDAWAASSPAFLEKGNDFAPSRARRRPALWLVGLGACLVFVLAGASSVYWYRSSPSFISVSPGLTRVTFDPGFSGYPALSPDGQMIAYASNRGGEDQLDIYVQRASSQTAVRMTRHPADDFQPSFSPDGSRIVFVSTRDGGGLYVLDTLSGQERRVAEGRTFFPRFSPDGSKIVFMRGPAYDASSGTVFLLDGEVETPLCQRIRPLLPPWSVGPVWSPKGDVVLFLGYSAAERGSDWWIAPTAEGDPVRIGRPQLPSLAQKLSYPLEWLDEGIVLVASNQMGASNLYLAPFSRENNRFRGSPRPVLQGTLLQFSGDVTKDGLMAVDIISVKTNFWRVPVTKDGLGTHGVLERVTDDLTAKSDMSLSKNGRWLAYPVSLSPEKLLGELRVRNLMDGEETLFETTGQSPVLLPRLNSDGSLLAYRDYEDGKYTTKLVMRSTRTWKRLCEDCFLLSFFSDDSAVVYQANKLYKQDLQTGKRDVIIESSSINDAVPSWDDRWIALSRPGPGETAEIQAAPLDRLPAPKESWVTVVRDGTYLNCPRWSPDGTILYFISGRDGHLCLHGQRVDPATKKPVGEPVGVHHQHSMRSGRFGPPGEFGFEVTQGFLVFNLSECSSSVWTARLPAEAWR